MKTLLIKFAVSAGCVLMLASCGTTKSAAEAQGADTYEQVALPVDEGTELKVPERQQIPLVKGADPVDLGTSSIFMYSMGGLDVAQVPAYYYYWPESGEFCMRFAGLTVKSYVLLDAADRSACRQSFEQYKKDFDAHVLLRDSDTYRAYGEVEAHYKWGLLGPSNETKPKMTIGYKFVKNSPYFTLTLWPAKGEYKNQAQQDDVADSEKTTMLMTKQQASDLIDRMDEKNFADIVDKMKAAAVKGDTY